jgi:hypothetical protein
MPSPEFTERAKNFQRTFAPYFPDLSDNFHAACVGTEYLWHGFRMNPLQTVRREQARRVRRSQKGSVLTTFARRSTPRSVPALMGITARRAFSKTF